jgi:hypothetical protein
MFELAARLVGVYKVNHMVSSPLVTNPRIVTNEILQTKSVTIENKDYLVKEEV